MTTWTTTTAVDLHLVTVGFDAQIDPATVTADHWSLLHSAFAAPCTVVATLPSPGLLSVDLWIEPGLTPTESYTLTAVGVLDANSAGVLGSPQAFAAPNILVTPSPEWPHKPLRSILRAFGEELQLLSGAPVTMTTSDYTFVAGELRHLYVESTLGFPDSGAVWAGGRNVRYSGREPCALLNAREVAPGVTRTIPQRSEVHVDVFAHFPD